EEARRRLGKRRLYRVVPVAEVAAEPVWPDAMPPDVREKSEDEPWVRQMFRRTLSEASALIDRGVEYFFVSSYTLRGVYEARWYPPDSPVYYMTLREKLGYESLLADPRVSLVRTWEPGGDMRGPALSLYRIRAS
ncbi:MAG: hypothetical protein ABIH26_01170, partial [Candidatus Eisenbacteria bacterium]